MLSPPGDEYLLLWEGLSHMAETNWKTENESDKLYANWLQNLRMKIKIQRKG